MPRQGDEHVVSIKRTALAFPRMKVRGKARRAKRPTTRTWVTAAEWAAVPPIGPDLAAAGWTQVGALAGPITFGFDGAGNDDGPIVAIQSLGKRTFTVDITPVDPEQFRTVLAQIFGGFPSHLGFPDSSPSSETEKSDQ